MNFSTSAATAAVGHDPRAFHVHPHRFAGIFLHQRDVLVGSGVEDDLGFIGIEQRCYLVLVTHVSDYGDECQVGKFLFQFQAQVVHGRFGHIQQDHLFDYVERGYLAAELAPDGTAAPRYEYRFVPEAVGHGFQVDAYFFPAQQVFYGYGAYLQADGIIFPVFVNRRGDHDLDFLLGTERNEPFFFSLYAFVGGKQDGLGFVFVHDLFHKQ